MPSCRLFSLIIVTVATLFVVTGSGAALSATSPPCAPVPGPSDIFIFEDVDSILVTDFPDAEWHTMQVAAALALVATHGDNRRTKEPGRSSI